MAQILKLTTAGRTALVAPNGDGTAARLVTQVGITGTAFAFDASHGAVPNEIKRLSTISGTPVAPGVIHVMVRDNTLDAFTVRGLGFYLDDGTLVGTYSQAEPILIKASASVMLLAFDATLLDGSVDLSQLTFGDTNFLNPPATTQTQGIARFATVEEHSGDSESIAATPKGLKAVVGNAIRQYKAGDALPASNIGVIWHADFNSLMSWQVFNANGANYTGYASIYIGRLEPDSQPTARVGKLKTGASNLPKTMSLWHWAQHVGIVVPLASWTPGMNAYADNGDGTFRTPDLRAESLRIWDDERGVDINRLFTEWQSGQFPSHSHLVYGEDNSASPTGPQSGEVANVQNAGSPSAFFSAISGSAGGTNNNSENRMRNFVQLGTIQK